MKSQKRNEPKCAEPAPRLQLSLCKKIAFATFTVVLFFGAIEFGLILLGVKPANESGDPLVGFSRKLPHFVESESRGGRVEIVTAPDKRSALNVQSFSREKSAISYRIACLGGSTTYGCPFWDETSFAGWLRAFLPVATGAAEHNERNERNWEVINAGGISYASYRILGVIEELATYQPDLYIVYLGHNEFLEKRTYGDLLNRPEIFNDLTASAYQLRISTVMKSAFTRLRGDKKPIILGENVDRIPLDAVGPDAYKRDDRFKKKVNAHLRLSLQRMIDVAASGGADVLFILPASNFRQAAPFKSEHTAGHSDSQLRKWKAADSQARFFASIGSYDEAQAQLAKCIAIDPRYAETYYLLGQALFELGRNEEARAALVRAIEEDICPLRATEATRQVIKDEAEKQNLAVIDFQELLESETATGITGVEFFNDHLHPNIKSNQFLARAILETGSDRGWWQLDSDWSDDKASVVAKRVTGNLDNERYAEELCKLAHTMAAFSQEELALASIRDALAFAPESEATIGYAVALYREMDKLHLVAELLESRLQSHPGDKRALTTLADLQLEMKRPEGAIDTYRRLLKLDSSSPEILQRMGVLLSQTGKHAEAVEHLQSAVELLPDSADVRNNLGLVFAKSGQPERAIIEYEKAIAISPSLSSAYLNYGLALEALGRREEAVVKYRHLLWMIPYHTQATERLQALNSP